MWNINAYGNAEYINLTELYEELSLIFKGLEK